MVVFPTPASPPRSTSWPRPSIAVSSSLRRSRSSRSRPTRCGREYSVIGVRSAGGVTTHLLEGQPSPRSIASTNLAQRGDGAAASGASGWFLHLCRRWYPEASVALPRGGRGGERAREREDLNQLDCTPAGGPAPRSPQPPPGYLLGAAGAGDDTSGPRTRSCLSGIVDDDTRPLHEHLRPRGTEDQRTYRRGARGALVGRPDRGGGCGSPGGRATRYPLRNHTRSGRRNSGCPVAFARGR